MTGNVATTCADVVSCKSPSHDGCFVHTLDLPSPSIMCSTSHIHHLAPPFDRGKLRCCSSDAMWVSITWCLCSVEQVYAYPAPAPPESHHGGTAHEAPTNTGHCTYQVIRAPVLKNTFSEKPLVSKCLCEKAWNSDFPSACLNPRFIYIRRKSRTFWGFPEVISTDTTNRIF